MEKIWKINGVEMTDRDVVSAILNKNTEISKVFFYRTCFPLFAKAYRDYYTDCEDIVEFINEIYLYLLYPNKETKECKLESFNYRCTLTLWLKIVTENYCHHIFAKKISKDDKISELTDRLMREDDSFETSIKELNADDVSKILLSMPNERYRNIIQYRYLDGYDNEETAKLLSINMANYYNKHKLAKAQFCAALRKEGLL